jgi:holliday junction DNA helicase RuvA
MYAYLKGIVAEKIVNANKIILELNGIGYLLETNLKTISQVKLGQELTLHTSLIINDSGLRFIGFKQKIEKEMFELLLSVSGVGPKAGLSLLNTFAVDELMSAIVQEQTKLIASAPGLGLKGAAKIILELKNKLAKLNPTLMVNNQDYKCSEDIGTMLNNLGFDAVEINRILNSAKAEAIPDQPESLIKFALQSRSF